MADFEIAIHNAVKSVWPYSKIVGCRFHLAQSWYRKIQRLGLVTEYKNANTEVGKWLNYLFGLPFLNQEDVSDCFIFDLMAIQPADEKIVSMVETYIGEDSLFPPEMWTACTSSIERTTNCCESFHSKFNENFYKTHPSLYVFINVLNDFQTESLIKLNSVGENRRIKDPETRRRQQFVQNKIDQYVEIGRLQYIKCLGYFYKQM